MILDPLLNDWAIIAITIRRADSFMYEVETDDVISQTLWRLTREKFPPDPLPLPVVELI
jgi:hypothetical protein